MTQDVIQIWQEKLAFLECELAKASSAAQRFEIQKQITECQDKLAQLTGRGVAIATPLPEPQPVLPSPPVIQDARGQYRSRVREYLSEHVLSAVAKIRLQQLQRSLGLSPAEAEAIVSEEEAPFQQARADYAEMLEQLIDEGHYPFDAATERELQRLRQELGLTDQEVEMISQPILRQAVTWRYFEVEAITFEPGSTTLTVTSAKFFAEDLGNGVFLDMVQIPGGSFLMGSPDGEGEDREYPQHEVRVSAFCLGKYPVTQAQYEAVMGQNPSYFKGKNLPVEQVSWHDAVAFCQRLSERSGRTYRLPSEAEWEYACRAGTTTKYSFGDDEAELGDYAWFGNNSGDQTHPVGEKQPNLWGLYDMHGNVWEWCQDCWHGNYQGAPMDSRAWLSGNDNHLRILRGGSWVNDPRNCRSAYRCSGSADSRYYFDGFRVVYFSATALL